MVTLGAVHIGLVYLSFITGVFRGLITSPHETEHSSDPQILPKKLIFAERRASFRGSRAE